MALKSLFLDLNNSTSILALKGKVANFLILLLSFCIFINKLNSQNWTLKYRNKEAKIDSIIVYNLNNERMNELSILLKNKLELDTSYFIYVIYSKKFKICVKEKLGNFNCDTIKINVQEKYNCSRRRHTTILSYNYCDKKSSGASDYSLYFPCCRK